MSGGSRFAGGSLWSSSPASSSKVNESAYPEAEECQGDGFLLGNDGEPAASRLHAMECYSLWSVIHYAAARSTLPA